MHFVDENAGWRERTQNGHVSLLLLLLVLACDTIVNPLYNMPRQKQNKSTFRPSFTKSNVLHINTTYAVVLPAMHDAAAYVIDGEVS